MILVDIDMTANNDSKQWLLLVSNNNIRINFSLHSVLYVSLDGLACQFNQNDNDLLFHVMPQKTKNPYNK